MDGSQRGSAAGVANPIACPFLGLADDPRTHFAFSITAHRCHSGSRPERIEIAHQERYCLGGDYPACQRYAQAGAPAAGVAVPPSGAPLPVELRLPSRPARTIGLDARQRTVVVRAAALAGVLVVVIVAMELLGRSSVIAPGASSSLPSSSPQAASTDAVPSPSPSGSVRSLPTTHIVARGETLTSIARHYGVTVAAIQKANGIKDPNLIRVGRRLIIPAR